LATHLYRRGAPAAAQPLRSAERLVFATGPLTGTLAPNGGRFVVVSKGKKAGAPAAASLGGSFGAEVKFAGFDAIILEGRAPEPVYLWIANHAAELRPAGHLWGMTASQTLERIAAETSAKAKTCCLGPAGEKGAGQAVVVSTHAAPAGGEDIGAVMGFKNLKAVAVQGTLGFRVAAPREFLAAAAQLRAKLAARPLLCRGFRMDDSVLLVVGARQDGEGREGEWAMPHGCLACSTKFASFRMPEGEVRAGDWPACGGLAGAPEAMVWAQVAGSEPAPGAYPPTEHGGCRVGGYTIMPRLVAGDSAEQALAAVADSATLCPFALAALDAADIAALLSTATGIAYSAEEVMGVGQRLAEEWGASP